MHIHLMQSCRGQQSRCNHITVFMQQTSCRHSIDTAIPRLFRLKVLWPEADASILQQCSNDWISVLSIFVPCMQVVYGNVGQAAEVHSEAQYTTINRTRQLSTVASPGVGRAGLPHSCRAAAQKPRMALLYLPEATLPPQCHQQMCMHPPIDPEYSTMWFHEDIGRAGYGGPWNPYRQ
jgi:hypothetical protein